MVAARTELLNAIQQRKNLIEEAERWAYGGELKGQADAVAFLRFAVERVNETELL
jgi:hypothetical protein